MPDAAGASRLSHTTRFVLMNTSHPGNVGATARAIKVMGFDDLVLVAPRDADVLTHPQALAMASGAVDVLAKVRKVATLVEALNGIACVCATAMTPRDFGPPTHAPREWLAQQARSGDPADRSVAFVLGSERYGMSNEDVYRCHVCLSIPTLAEYGSLNLAQAVQLLAYEWREALGGFQAAGLSNALIQPNTRADAASIQQLLVHWEHALIKIGFLDSKKPRKLIPRLNGLLNRAKLTPEDINILRGIARTVLKG
jgi:tRNA/rRNA methyltransferase